jgi:hypothetical protein
LWAETSKGGLEAEDIEAVVADGSVWIWNQAQTNYGWAIQVVDWYHVNERVWLVLLPRFYGKAWFCGKIG